jgi:hypothetical protein
MNPILAFVALSSSLAPQDALPPEVEAKNRTVARLEERFAALAPYTAEYQAIIVRPDGTEEPGSEFLFWTDYLGLSLYSRTKIADPDNGNPTLYTILEKEQVWVWRDDGKEGFWGDLSDYFTAIRSALDLTRRDLNRILPRTSEDPDPGLCHGLQIVLDVHRKKDAKDERGGVFQFSVSLMTSPASWLAEARGARDARMTDGPAGLSFALPEDPKTMVVDKDNGLLLRVESKDYDGVTRRIVRRSFRANTEPPAFQRPRGAALKPFPLGALRGYVSAFRQAIILAAGRVLWNWDRLGDHRAEVPALVSEWMARYLDLWAMIFLDDAADGYVKERLNGGDKLDALERDVEQEARRLGERLAKDSGFADLGRKVLKECLDEWEASHASHPNVANREPFMKAIRAGFSPDEVFPKVSKVREAELRRALRGAVKRAGQL